MLSFLSEAREALGSETTRVHHASRRRGGGFDFRPLAARAQPADKSRHIGALMMYAENDARGQSFVAAFREELRKLGRAEGQSLRIDYRWSTSAPDAIERSVKELIALQPDLILSSSTPTTASLLRQTRTIPIIFANIVDPVGSGFVASLARPGGNVTGFLNFEFSMGGKWVELLREIAPRVSNVAALFNPATAPYAETYLQHVRAAAQSLGIEAATVPVRDMTEVDAAIAAQAGKPNGGFIVVPDGFMVAHHAAIAAAAARHRVPAAYFFRAFTDAAGCCRTETTLPTTTDAPLPTPTEFSKASERASFRCSSRSSSSW